jgi:hypothetical protein
MKKILFSLILLSVSVAGFSQALKPVKIDSLVTVSMPAIYQKKDTLGQQIFTGNGMFGTTVVIRAANDKNNTPLKKEGDLNAVLKKYIASIQGQSGGGSALHVRDTTVGTLKAKVFTLKNSDNAENVQFINFTLIYTQDATYTFEYVYPETRQELVKDEYKAYISSIKLAKDLQRNDQYLYKSTGMSQVAKIGVYGGGAILLILLIVVVARRRKRLAIS